MADRNTRRHSKNADYWEKTREVRQLLDNFDGDLTELARINALQIELNALAERIY